MKSVQPNKSPRERREALLEKKRASSCTSGLRCSVPVATLQAWALDLSQGDNSPRWEIEKLLTDAGHDIRDRSI